MVGASQNASPAAPGADDGAEEPYACPTELPLNSRAYRDAVCRVVLLADARGRLSELLQYYPGRAGEMLLYLAQEWVAEKLEACDSGKPHDERLCVPTP
jgi:hypothetical protein